MIEIGFLQIGYCFSIVSGLLGGDSLMGQVDGEVEPQDQVGTGKSIDFVFDFFDPAEQFFAFCSGSL